MLVEGEGLRLTSERLEAEGRSWRLEELLGFGTRRESPGLWLPLGVGGSAALLVPGLLLQPGSFRVTAALVVATLLVFAAIARVVAAADTYRLLVRTAEGERRCGADRITSCSRGWCASWARSSSIPSPRVRPRCAGSSSCADVGAPTGCRVGGAWSVLWGGSRRVAAVRHPTQEPGRRASWRRGACRCVTPFRACVERGRRPPRPAVRGVLSRRERFAAVP
ncbi:DUF6232 family protein [Cystobacter fuscus]